LQLAATRGQLTINTMDQYVVGAFRLITLK